MDGCSPDLKQYFPGLASSKRAWASSSSKAPVRSTIFTQLVLQQTGRRVLTFPWLPLLHHPVHQSRPCETAFAGLGHSHQHFHPHAVCAHVKCCSVPIGCEQNAALYRLDVNRCKVLQAANEEEPDKRIA